MPAPPPIVIPIRTPPEHNSPVNSPGIPPTEQQQNAIWANTNVTNTNNTNVGGQQQQQQQTTFVHLGTTVPAAYLQHHTTTTTLPTTQQPQVVQIINNSQNTSPLLNTNPAGTSAFGATTTTTTTGSGGNSQQHSGGTSPQVVTLHQVQVHPTISATTAGLGHHHQIQHHQIVAPQHQLHQQIATSVSHVSHPNSPLIIQQQHQPRKTSFSVTREGSSPAGTPGTSAFAPPVNHAILPAIIAANAAATQTGGGGGGSTSSGTSPHGTRPTRNKGIVCKRYYERQKYELALQERKKEKERVKMMKISQANSTNTSAPPSPPGNASGEQQQRNVSNNNNNNATTATNTTSTTPPGAKENDGGESAETKVQLVMQQDNNSSNTTSNNTSTNLQISTASIHSDIHNNTITPPLVLSPRDDSNVGLLTPSSLPPPPPTCKFSHQCPFRHVGPLHEDPVPRSVCKFFSQGACLRDSCPFFHGSEEKLQQLLSLRQTTYKPGEFCKVVDAEDPEAVAALNIAVQQAQAAAQQAQQAQFMQQHHHHHHHHQHHQHQHQHQFQVVATTSHPTSPLINTTLVAHHGHHHQQQQQQQQQTQQRLISLIPQQQQTSQQPLLPAFTAGGAPTTPLGVADPLANFRARNNTTMFQQQQLQQQQQQNSAFAGATPNS